MRPKRKDSMRSSGVFYQNMVSSKNIIDELRASSQEFRIKLPPPKIYRLRNLFIQKLGRALQSNQAYEIVRPVKQTSKWQRLPAVELREQIIHAVFLGSLIVYLILFALASFEGFIPNFRDETSFAAVLVVRIICLIINVLYFLLRCVTKSFNSLKNYNYAYEVFISYAKSRRFYLEIITILFQIFILIFPGVMAISGVFFFFLIVAVLHKIQQLIHTEAAYLKSQREVLIWGLIKICMGNFMVAHVMASILLVMGRINLENNWLIDQKIDQAFWWHKYFCAFYWGTTIMMTVGFGDFLPVVIEEIIVVSFLEMGSCILLGYNISEIGHLIGLLREKDELVNRKLATFRRMVQSKPKLKDANQQANFLILQKNIHTHLKQQNNRDKSFEYQLQNELLGELPEHLRRGYFHYINQRIFAATPFFKWLSRQTIEQLAEKFQNRHFYVGENIIDRKSNVLVLEDGTIGLGYKKKGSTINGEIFDEFVAEKGKMPVLLTTEFLGMKRNYALTSKTQSIIWTISLNDFEQVVVMDQQDHEYYFTVRHRHQIHEEQWNTRNECLRCVNRFVKVYHTVYDCPRVVYIPLRMNVVLSHLDFTDESKNPRKKRSQQFFRCQFIKTSAMKHKKTSFNQLIKKLNYELKPYEFAFQHAHRQQKQKNQKQQHEAPQIIYNSDIPTKRQVFEIVGKAVKKYDTGYEEDFWNLETDEIYDYNYYFSHHNARNFYKTKVHQQSKVIKDICKFLEKQFMPIKGGKI